MVFKLIRTDIEEPCKIQLPKGTHVFGRGQQSFLECDDKRVSRTHGQLDVTADSVTLISLHRNPCFFRKKGSLDTSVLQLNESVGLSHGDRFGLVPNSYWYELIHCNFSPDLTMGENVDNNDEVQQNVIDSNIAREQTNSNANDSVTTAANDEDSPIKFDTGENEESRIEGGPHSPSLIPLDKPNSPLISFTQQYNLEIERAGVKRCHSPVQAAADSCETQVKVKREPSTKDVEPSTSGVNDQSDSSNGATKDSKSLDSPNCGGNAQNRERCMYGASCYRKNRDHKVQFSHPGDSDWGTGARGTCPWGGTCMRRDPRHWRDHDHPPGAHPPLPDNPQHRRLRTVYRNGNIFYINASVVNLHNDYLDLEGSDGDSGRVNREVSPQDGADLPPKRVRRNVRRESCSEWTDDGRGSLSDPFSTGDESDEWTPSKEDPPSRDTESQDF